MAQMIRLIEKIAAGATWIGGMLLVLAAVLVCVEVFLRKVLLMSLGGADELSGYAFAIATSWGFAFALIHRAHVRIDVVYVRLSPAVRAWLDLVALISLGIFAVVLTRYAVDVFAFAVDEGTHSNTPLRTPMWIPQGLWVSGLFFFCCVIAVQAFRCVEFLRRREWMAVGRIAGTRSVEEEVDDEIDPTLESRSR